MMKVAELTAGAQLDYWVAKTEGFEIKRLYRSEYCDFDGLCVIRKGEMPSEIGNHYCPSLRWGIGGPIIEREQIVIAPSGYGSESLKWYARVFGEISHNDESYGPTPLVAAMRAFVGRKFGAEVPDAAKSGINSDSQQAK